MTVLLPLLAGPLLAAALGLGTAPAAPPPVITVPPVIHLSVAGGGVQAGQPLHVQAVVTALGGITEHGTVTFWIAGSSTKVGTVLDASGTAVGNLGPVTTGPTIVDATFVPTGGTAVTATAEATFRASAIPVTPFLTVDPATAGSPVLVHYGINVGPSGFTPNGHVDVMIGVASVRSGFCVLAPGTGKTVLGVWQCTAAIPSLPTGNVELHVVLADSPYYSSSNYLVVPVAAAPAAPAAPKTSSGSTATTPPSASTGPATASPTATAAPMAAGGTAASGAAPTTTVDRTPASATSAATSWLWILLLVIAIAAVLGAALLVVRLARRAGDPQHP